MLAPDLVIIDKISNAQGAAIGCINELKSGRRVCLPPFAKNGHDAFGFLDLVLQALAGVDIGDVDDRLELVVEHLRKVIEIGAGIEEVSDIERLQIFVAVELFVIGVGDRLELGLVCGRQNRRCIATKIGARHRDEMRLAARDQLAELSAEDVVRVRR